MPGPVAGRILSLLHDSKSSLKGIQDINGNVNDVEGLPTAFEEVAKHTPVICDALESARQEVQRKQDDSILTEITAFSEGCKTKTGQLGTLYTNVVWCAAAQRMERYREAVRGLEKGKPVEALMGDLLRDVIGLLKVDEEIKAATESHLCNLQEALKQVLKISPSLQDNGQALGINNYGSGPQNVLAGEGQQNNNNGTGSQFNATTISGISGMSSSGGQGS